MNHLSLSILTASSFSLLLLAGIVDYRDREMQDPKRNYTERTKCTVESKLFYTNNLIIESNIFYNCKEKGR